MCQKSWLTHNNISTTVHATTKLFVLFCSAQDIESTDINCLVFWAHCKNGNFWWNGKCAVDSERNDVIIFVIPCSVAEIFLCKNHKNSAFNNSQHKYLDNCTCYNKVVCTIPFSSRWWVYWYELFSVLSTLWKWQIFDEIWQVYNKGIFTDFG